MQVTITDTTGSDTLCDGLTRDQDKHCGPEPGWARASSHNAQIAEYIRGGTIKVFDRGNAKAGLKFSINRLCASIDAAISLSLLYPDQVRRFGTVTVISGTASVQILNAEIQSVQCVVTGISVKITYDIVGGLVQVTPAPGP